MKKSPLKRGTKTLKRSGFKRKVAKPLKRSSMGLVARSTLRKIGKSVISKLQKELYVKSHTFIRKRDSISDEIIGGYCVDCGEYAEGRNFQAGHFIADASGGAVLRYHPHNMHGQAGGCNMKYQQETVKINYTTKMIDKYGREYVDFLISIKDKSKLIKADEIFYRKMIELYDKGNEEEIINYLHSLII